MYWKFILVNLLLVVPDCRILTGGTVDISDLSSNDELVESIVDKLTQEQRRENIRQNNIDKKDKHSQAYYIKSNNEGVNFEAQDPVVSAPKVASSPTSSNKSEGSATPPPAGPSHQGHAAPGQAAPLQQPQQSGAHGDDDDDRKSRFIENDDKKFIIIVGVAVCTGFVGLMMAGVCYYKFRKSAKAASDVEYPAYGVTGPMKEKIPSPGDRKLAQSAQMYHYQHQKQQMIAMEKANGDMKHDASEDDSEEDNVEGDYTVYECPGLAPTGEMEVRNPLFRGEETPVSPGQDITGHPHGQEALPDPERQQK